MKNLLILLLLALSATVCRAQADRFHYPDAFYFVKEVPLESLQGKPFHFDISVKENPADSLSRPRIYAIQVRKGKEDFIGKSLTYARATGGDWKTYSIDGVVDKEATRIWLYVAVNGNGDFYFDNLHFSVADETGTLKEKELLNASFEEKKLLNGYYMSKRASSDIKISISTVANDGKQSVEISSTGQKAAGYHPMASN